MQLTAFLFGMSVLGAQIPLSTFARTDPDVAGFGLGASASFVSTLIGVYVIALVAGALLLPVAARFVGTRGRRCCGACLLVAIGYGLFLPLHGSTVQTLVNMAIAGLGSGALVAALPAAAAAAAPPDRTGFVTGMTNTTKTIGGAIASSIFAIALSSTGSIADAKAGPCSALRLPHGVGGLLDHGPGRGAQPVRRTEGRVQRLTFHPTPGRAHDGWMDVRHVDDGGMRIREIDDHVASGTGFVWVDVPEWSDEAEASSATSAATRW